VVRAVIAVIGHGRVGRRYLKDLAAGLGFQLVRRSSRDDLAMVDDHDVVGQLVGLVQVLRGEQDRDPVRDEAPDHRPHVGPAARVKPGRRLVQVQHPGIADQAGSQVQPAPHPARVRLRRPGGGIGEIEAGE
jgi:hypothetical protein